MNFRVPERLESSRLVLRQFRESDWRELHKYYSDAEATAFTFGRALTEGDSWRTMCTMIGHWQIRGYGPYAVEEKSSGNVLGTVGFWYPNDWPEPEIKWALVREYWGKGFAKEAALVVLEAGNEHLPDYGLISLIHSGNKPSIGLALSIGARLETTIEYSGKPHGIYRHQSSGR